MRLRTALRTEAQQPLRRRRFFFRGRNGQLAGHIEDAEPPVDVDWNDLKSINPDIVGWLYIDAEDNISYPICKGTDNSTICTIRSVKEALLQARFFYGLQQFREFTDPNTVIYGHNMKNGSMFGMLKFIKGQKNTIQTHIFGS